MNDDEIAEMIRDAINLSLDEENRTVAIAGKPAGKKYKLQPGDDPKTVAARLTKEAWMKRARESNFNRPLRYPRIGLA
jgi:hypothetical protein